MRWKSRTRWLATRPRWLRVSLAVVVLILTAPFVLLIFGLARDVLEYARESYAFVKEMWCEHPYGYRAVRAAAGGEKP